MANTLKLGAGKWATGKDTVLSFNDENGNFKPLPFSFSRASKATVVNQSGLIETVGSGEPRIDFQGNTKGALLLEPQRTNVITQSEAFANSYWTKTNTTVTSGFVSPNGTNNAHKVLPTASGTSYGNVSVSKIIGGQPTSIKTNSIFVKSNGQRWVYIFPSDGGNPTFFDLQDGVVGTINAGAEAKIETYSNGWYRLSLTQGIVSYNYFAIGFCDGDNSPTYTQSSNSIFIYGGQYELASYATSYIPTSGSAVTRVLDDCDSGGSTQVINSTEGVLYAEIAALADDFANYKFISLYDGTYNNFCDIYYGDASNRISVRFRSGAGGVINMFFAVSDIRLFNKVAISWKSNEFKLFINGVSRGLTTSGAAPVANSLNRLDFHQVNNSNPFYGNVKDIKIYNTSLTNAELAALTTI